MKAAHRRNLAVFVLLAMPLATSLSAYLAGEMSGRAAVGVALVDLLSALGSLAQPQPKRLTKGGPS